MSYADRALYLALTQDSVTAALLAGCTTTVLQVADASPWADVEWINVRAAAASVPGTRNVARIASVDEMLNTVTLDRPLLAVPAADNILGGGYVQWALPVSAGAPDLLSPAYGDAEHPGKKLLTSESEPRAVVVYGEIGSQREAFTAVAERWRFRVLSRSPQWRRAMAARIRRKLDGRRGALTIPGRAVYSVAAYEVTTQLRDDVLAEEHVQVYVTTSQAVAA